MAASSAGTETGTRGPQGPTGATGPQGAQGVSVDTVTINVSNELVITLTDGTVFNLGNVKGDTGPQGPAGTDGTTPDLDIVSGSSLTYHNMSGSTFTSNLLDSDRAEINEIEILLLYLINRHHLQLEFINFNV